MLSRPGCLADSGLSVDSPADDALLLVLHHVNTLLRYLRNLVRYFSYDPETDIGRYQEPDFLGEDLGASESLAKKCPLPRANPTAAAERLQEAWLVPALLNCRGAAGEIGSCRWRRALRSSWTLASTFASLSDAPVPVSYLRQKLRVANPTGVFAPPSAWARS